MEPMRTNGGSSVLLMKSLVDKQLFGRVIEEDYNKISLQRSF